MRLFAVARRVRRRVHAGVAGVFPRLAAGARAVRARLAPARDLVAAHPRAAGGAAVVVAVGLGFWALPVVRFARPLSTVLFARDGALLSATTASDGQWRFPARAHVPPKYAAAVVAYEDRRFRRHPGVDAAAVARAVVANLRAGRVVSGASTLTMQVVRLARDRRQRTYREKLVEMLLALRLELAASKDEVLALYAANAPFGGNVVGLDAAAWRYFGTRPEALSWAEAAALAVLPNSPALVHPGRNRERLRARRDRLLEVLRDDGAIDALACDAAKSEPLPPAPVPIPQLAPHLLARVKGRARASVTTTLDLALQRRVAEIVRRRHEALAGNQVHNAAALVVDVATGEVLAYVGNVLGPDAAAHGGHVDVVTAARSTGSVLKPLLYAAALDAGELLPTELLEDTPLRIGGFAPENSSRTFAGAVPAAVAVARSLNVPAVRLLQDYGVDRFYGVLTRLGVTTLARPASHYGLSLILGGAEGTLWDLTGVYAGLARQVALAARGDLGSPVLAPPHFAGGPPARRPAPIGPGAAYVMLQAMLELERPGAEASWREFAAPRRVAWKTGTSFGFRDAWAVGATSRHAVGVWAGNVDGEGRPGLTGFAAAAPILFDIVDALGPSPWFEAPGADLADLEVCRKSGRRAGPRCAAVDVIRAPRAGVDAEVCGYCQVLHLDSSGAHRVHGDCEPVHRMQSVARFVLPPAMEWFYRMRHADYAPVPPWRRDCTSGLGPAASSLSVLYPRQDAVIYVPRELDGTRGRAVFEAAHREPAATLFWHVDDAYQGATRDVHQLAVAPAPGPHVLTVVDDGGGRVERRFVVIGEERR